MNGAAQRAEIAQMSYRSSSPSIQWGMVEKKKAATYRSRPSVDTPNASWLRSFHLYSPIFSALSDSDELSVAVGEESQPIVIRTDEPPIARFYPLAVLRRVLNSSLQQFHFRQVDGEGEAFFYEIGIHYRRTSVKGREIIAIPGEPPQKWILEYLPKQRAFV
ncbi:hypothetical protein SCLCIDRAFT_912447 [Scleroderma citrinum Foug A]|uniref:Uncharacterized protein n=1 Tax=Scleroderma citrinum Foug A TaxID=1036808 RepID=A0A0C3DKP6_9AGAM|nr:hypothetical protein SCLCIDRAFT_912447 [Scleroderma citrinum Foug A]